MAFQVYGRGKLALTGGVSATPAVGVTVYEVAGGVAAARSTAGIVELGTNSGEYVASISVPADPRRVLWMVFDDARGDFSEAYLCGATPAEMVAGDLLGTITDPVPADIRQIDMNADAAARLRRSANAICLATVSGSPSTTSIPTTGMVPAATQANQFKGRILIFDKDTTTAALRGQGAEITANTNVGVLTVTPLTTAPVAGDTFTIT